MLMEGEIPACPHSSSLTASRQHGFCKETKRFPVQMPLQWSGAQGGSDIHTCLRIPQWYFKRPMRIPITKSIQKTLNQRNNFCWCKRLCMFKVAAWSTSSLLFNLSSGIFPIDLAWNFMFCQVTCRDTVQDFKVRSLKTSPGRTRGFAMQQLPRASWKTLCRVWLGKARVRK